jgi:hypothetical protein
VAHARWCLLFALALCVPAAAVDQLQLSLAEISGEGWQAQGVRLLLTLGEGEALDIDVTADVLNLPSPIGSIANPSLRCPRAQLSDQRLACAAGTLVLQTALLDNASVPVHFSYSFADGALTLALQDVALARGRVSLLIASDPAGWRVDLKAASVDLEPLTASFGRLAGLPAGFAASGTADIDMHLSGNGDVWRTLTADIDARQLAFASASGRYAGEALNASVKATLTAETAGWHGDLTLTGHGGTLCIDTCWEFPEMPVTFAARPRWQADRERLSLQRLTVAQGTQVQARADMAFDFAAPSVMDFLHLEIAPSQLEPLYSVYLQPLLIGTLLENVETGGMVSAKLSMGRDSPLLVSLTPQDVVITDRDGRFAVNDLNGAVDWADDEIDRSSRLSWSSAQLYRLDVGASGLTVRTRGMDVALTEPAIIPILDGALHVNTFVLENPGTDAMKWTFDGMLTPISMRAFTRAMDWPEMHGKLSGMIPGIRYDKHLLEVDGVLLIRIFDGAITLRDLQLERLFGTAPTLRADIDFDNLDLDTLTRTFSFGNIQGRFSGRVHDLTLQDWTPVAFDAEFATPEDDRSRHRISQRAVDNLTSLGGGGVGGALSRSFLRFFEEFSYDRVGIRCRLSHGVCAMGGVQPVGNGYYIVKGGGLPRIDVIGYADRVDWRVLMQRLKTITAGTPTVQ